MNHLPVLMPDASKTAETLEEEAHDLLGEGLGYESSIAAIQAFLGQETTIGREALSLNTKLLYEREFLKLLLFMKEKGIPSLWSITRPECRQFLRWLSKPPGHLIATKGRRVSRSHPDWRPFSSIPMVSSINSSHRIMKSLYRWLQNCGLAQSNPWAMVKEEKTDARGKQQQYNLRKTLTKNDIAIILQYLRTPFDQQDIKAMFSLNRRRWIFYAYLLLGLRASELVNLTTDQLTQRLDDNDQPFWELTQVKGKGGTTLDVSVPNLFVQEMRLYRLSLGKESLPESGVPDPFIFSLDGKSAITSRQHIFGEYKKLMLDVAKSGLCTDDEQIKRIIGTSPHSLRHTYVTNLMNITNDYAAVKTLARHANIDTTMSYDNSEKHELNKLVESLAKGIDL